MRQPLGIREQMREVDIETILQRAREAFQEARPTITSDNGPQFVAKDRATAASGVHPHRRGMQHIRTSPYYPRSKSSRPAPIDRWHATIKGEAIRPGTPLSLDAPRRIVERIVAHDNDVRLHSANGYVAPRSRLEGKDAAIQAARDARLEAAREAGKKLRQAARVPSDDQACARPLHVAWSAVPALGPLPSYTPSRTSARTSPNLLNSSSRRTETIVAGYR